MFAAARLSLAAILLVSITMLTGSTSRADFVFEFGDDSGNVASDGSPLIFNASPGDTVSLIIYLTQTGTNTELNSPATALAIADYELTITSGGVGVMATAFSIDNGFVDDGSGNTGIDMGTQTVRFASTGPDPLGRTGITAAADGVIDNSVRLGSVSYTIDAGAVGPVVITAAPSAGSFFQTALANPDFPTLITPGANTVTINLAAVPEPSSLAGLAMFGLVALRTRRRRDA